MNAILYGVPVLLGFVCGYFLTLPVVVVLSAVALLIAAYALWTTKDLEIGALIGVIAAIEIAIFLASLWVTTVIVSGWLISIDLHWLLRV